MGVFKMSNRPKSREKNYSGKSTDVYVRKNNRSASNQIIKGGSGIGIIGIIIFILFSLLNGGNVSTTTNDLPTYNQSLNDSYAVINDNKVNHEVSDLARKKYTVSGSESVTVMVYMLGSDLETRYGMATRDLNEMLHATIGDNLNIVVETGGAKQWQNSVISNSTNQRYLVTNKQLLPLDKNVGLKNMTDPDSLSDFIKFSASNYPADRYILVMWDHGAGSVNGFGYDEHFPNNTMSIDEIAGALKKGGVKFDIVGFDACLMATLENAIALEPYADYLLASEEVEPGTGWYYTNWLTSLNNNPAISSLDLAKTLIDDYIASSNSSREQLTLSITDLAELNGTLKDSLKDFSINISETLKSDRFKEISDARSTAKEFSKASRLDQIDLYDFAIKVNTQESINLANVIKSAVKYNRSKNISNANGLSIYFPYSSLNKMNSMVQIYENIDIDENYSDAIKSFATLTSSGQIVSDNSGSSATSLIDTLLGNYYEGTSSVNTNDIFSLLTDSNDAFSGIFGGNSDWLNSDSLMDIAQIIGRNRVDSNNFVVTNLNGQKVLSLSEEEWSLIKDIELNVFVDDGEGFIDLGLDNVFEFNDKGDLIVEYDSSWLALNDNIVAYYMVSSEVSDNYYKISGYIPAYLNGEYVQIMVEFTSDDKDGKVLGAKYVYDNVEQEAKGLVEIKSGDVLRFVCNYHSYDGSMTEAYPLNEDYTVSGDLVLSNIYINNPDLVYSYRLTDIYNNRYWLEAFRVNK